MKKTAVIAGAMLIMTALAAEKTLADGQVVEEWVARYDRAGSADWASDMAMDGSGNIYVTGTSYSGPNEFCITIKYSPDSNEPDWVAQYDITGNYNDFRSYITLDDLGNIYVAGAKSTTIGCDYLTIKYDADGNEVWSAIYDGPANGDDWTTDIAVDNAGDIYVTGASDGNETGLDYATVKYASDSNIPVWVARYDGPASGEDRANAIAIDNSGNIYVTGVSDGNETYGDYVTIGYTADSNEPVWIARYNGPASGVDLATAIAVDYSGDVYVTGDSSGDYATVKYSPESNEPVWIARYDGPSNGYDKAVAIVIDDLKNIYVTGRSEGVGTGYDYLTIKYYSNSNWPVWIARYDGPANDYDEATAVDLDKFGNIYVTGFSVGNGTEWDYSTIRYIPDSNEPVWIARYDGPGNDDDLAEAVSVDKLGNVYVTGVSGGIGTGGDYATIKYSQPGFIKAGVSMVFNGSFENPGWIDNGQESDIDVSEKPPKRWCDVNLPDGFGAKIKDVNDDWSTRGDHSLTINTKFQSVDLGDLATVSQQVYLEDVNIIIFDVNLTDTWGWGWNPDSFSAVVLIDGNEVWNSYPKGEGVYLDQQVSVDQYYKDEFPHTLSLGIIANRDGQDSEHEAQWDLIRFDTHNYGGYGYGVPFVGDFNYDGDVDIVDLKMLAGQWLSDEPNETYDLYVDEDDTINFHDFSVFADNWMAKGTYSGIDGLLAADLNDDGIVNFLDFAIVGREWTSEGVCIRGDIDGTEFVGYGDVYKLIEQWLMKSWLYGLE